MSSKCSAAKTLNVITHFGKQLAENTGRKDRIRELSDGDSGGEDDDVSSQSSVRRKLRRLNTEGDRSP
jgi:hypothetical protein